MATILGLDIPDELLHLFQAVLQLKPNGTINGVGLTLPKTTQRKNTLLRGRSFFVQLQPYWVSLTSLQKAAWEAYWETLPFGDHSGSGGWPGSGYSAFVYINAANYRNGDDIQLDPPSLLGPELLTNPNFETGDDWDLQDYTAFVDDHFEIHAEGDEYFGEISQVFDDGLANGMYRVEVEISIPAGVVGNYTPIWGGDGTDLGAAAILTSGSGVYAGETIPDWAGDHQVFSQDVNYSNDPTTNGFGVVIAGNTDNGVIKIWRVSLKKYS